MKEFTIVYKNNNGYYHTIKSTQKNLHDSLLLFTFVSDDSLQAIISPAMMKGKRICTVCGYLINIDKPVCQNCYTEYITDTDG